MLQALILSILLVSALILPAIRSAPTASATPISIYGAWHCSNDACTWGTVRDMTDFDTKNRWLVDRGNGSG